MSGSSSPPTPTAPRTPSFHTHQALNPLLFFLIITKSNLCFPNIVEYVALYKAIIEFPGKADSPFPCSYQLSLTPQIRVDFMTVSLLYVGVLSGSSLPRSCVCCHNCCEFICTAALWCPEDTCIVTQTAGSCTFCSLSCDDDSWAFGGRGVT